MPMEQSLIISHWKLYVDGLLMSMGAGIVLVTPKNQVLNIEFALSFQQ